VAESPEGDVKNYTYEQIQAIGSLEVTVSGELRLELRAYLAGYVEMDGENCYIFVVHSLGGKAGSGPNFEQAFVLSEDEKKEVLANRTLDLRSLPEFKYSDWRPNTPEAFFYREPLRGFAKGKNEGFSHPEFKNLFGYIVTVWG
jgi:hypothetical protein